MANTDLVVGDFQIFNQGIEAATLSGSSIERSCGILGSRPPFREPAELEQLTFRDAMMARRMAVDASGVVAVAQEAGKADTTIEIVVFSRAGALALRNTEFGDAKDETIQLISFLDNDNISVTCHAHAARIG